MFNSIARLYDDPNPGSVNVIAGSGLRVVSQGIKFVVRHVVGKVPLTIRPLVHGAAAALVIEAIGHATIEYFESKHPNRPFSAS